MAEPKWSNGEWKTRQVPLFDIQSSTIIPKGKDPDRWYIIATERYQDGSEEKAQGLATSIKHLAIIERCGDMSDAELIANANLFAAAPDLAEALKPFDKWLSTMPDHLAFDDPEKIIAGEGDYAIRAKHLRAARLALSRATGGDNG